MTIIIVSFTVTGAESTDNSKKLVIIVASVIAVFVFIILVLFAGLYKYRFQKNNKPDKESSVIENPAFDTIDISPREGNEENYPPYDDVIPSDYGQLDSSRRVTEINNKPDKESSVIENPAFDTIDISPREGNEENYPLYDDVISSDYAQPDSSCRVTHADSNYQGLLIHTVDPELTVPSDEDKIDKYTQLTKERDAGEPYTLLILDRGEASVHPQLQVHAINPTNDIEHQENEHTYEEIPY